jgi:uncharacterized Fe-S cluster-containing MiaB family protein
MEEFIKIRIEELKVLKENLIQKHREELARVDVRIDELNSMLDPNGVAVSSSEEINIDTVDKVSEVLNETKKEIIVDDNQDYLDEKQEDTEDSLSIDLEIDSPSSSKKTQTMEQEEEVDIEAMLNEL